MSEDATFGDKLFNFTYIVSNPVADAVGECYTTAFGFYEWSINLFF